MQIQPTVAAQRLAAGEPGFRPICGMGICFECRSAEGVRTCRHGPGAETSLGAADTCPEGPHCSTSSEIVVVGGGPAGIAAACAARECGLQTLLVDDNPSPGGQIWRSGTPPRWQDRLNSAGVDLLPDTAVVANPAPGILLAESRLIRYRKLILAPGARELFLPFPGWTLPRVTGAGGLQAFVKSGLPIQGKRVVIAGTGPLLVAVASYLRRQGARVVLIAEQATWPRLLPFAAAVARDPKKLAESLSLASHRYLPNCWPIAAEGRDRLEAVQLRRGARTWREPCDYLACGFGLAPNLELPQLVGCAIRQGSVATDEFQRTSVPDVYYAGDLGGVDLVLAEGEIAGYAAAGRPEDARKLFRARARARRFRAAVDRAFALREELRALPQPDTIVCRCENVTFGALQTHQSWRSAKLHTRCGMGPCQGRVCGAALQFLRGWTVESVRPPVFPCSLQTLLGIIE